MEGKTEDGGLPPRAGDQKSLSDKLTIDEASQPQAAEGPRVGASSSPNLPSGISRTQSSDHVVPKILLEYLWLVFTAGSLGGAKGVGR